MATMRLREEIIIFNIVVTCTCKTFPKEEEAVARPSRKSETRWVDRFLSLASLLDFVLLPVNSLPRVGRNQRGAWTLGTVSSGKLAFLFSILCFWEDYYLGMLTLLGTMALRRQSMGSTVPLTCRECGRAHMRYGLCSLEFFKFGLLVFGPGWSSGVAGIGQAFVVQYLVS